MTYYANAVGYTFVCCLVFLAGVAVGIVHERHRLARLAHRHRRRVGRA